MIEVKYIDRRQCRRVVPMQVLCLGASRTGTESMRRALTTLGYDHTYHGFAASFEAPYDCKMWLEALNAKFRGKGKKFGREEWDMLLGHCRAVTDAPAMCFSAELIEAYPDAKVILTLRDVDKWYQSLHDAALLPFYSLPGKITGYINLYTLSPFRFSKPVFDIIWEDFFHVSDPNSPDPSVAVTNERNAKAAFNEHYDLVRSIVPKERLLEYRVQEGWGPLCEFLGKEVPDEDFPRGNDKQDLQLRIDAFGRESLRLLGWKLAGVIGMGSAVWAAIKLWS